MINIKAAELAQIIGAEPNNNISEAITGISTDSRTILKGDCFFAIKGEKFNGADFLAAAAQNGGLCAVVEDEITDAPLPILKTDSTLTALANLARHIRHTRNFQVIAITGSAGKTTTKNIICHVLSKKYKCFQSPKSYNNKIGLPLTICQAPKDTEILIAELGTNAPGEIEYLTKIVCPDTALVTNIYPAHLQGFKTIGAIAAEKASIALGLKQDSKFIINSDFEILEEYCRRQNLRYASFSAVNITSEPGDTHSLTTAFKIDGQKIEIPLLGRANIENTIAAWAVCKNFNFTVEEFAQSLKDIKPVEMRLTPVKLASALLIDDCYNANPASMANALDTLNSLGQKQNRRKVFICGQMGELGAESEKYHRRLGAQAAKAGVKVLLTIKSDAEFVADSALRHCRGEIKVKVFENTAQLCNNLHKFVNSDDIILVKASRSEHFETVSEKLKEILT